MGIGEVAEIDAKRARTRASGRSEEGKRDRIHRWRQLRKRQRSRKDRGRKAQSGAVEVEPTQKPGLAGSVWTVGPPKGVITVLPLSDVVKSYVLPTILALALEANARAKAADAAAKAA